MEHPVSTLQSTIVQPCLSILEFFLRSVLQRLLDLLVTQDLFVDTFFGFGALVSGVGLGLLKLVNPGYACQSELFPDGCLISSWDGELGGAGDGGGAFESTLKVLHVKQTRPGHQLILTKTHNIMPY